MNWVIDFGRPFDEVELPNFNGNIIYITSDYSGSHKYSQYEVISFLYMDLQQSLPWEFTRRRWREEHLSNGRRLSFKGLGDRQKQEALIPFLIATKDITGLVVNIIISKLVKNIWCDNDLFSMVSPMLTGKWNTRMYEKAFCISHFVALLIAGLSKPNQSVCWISDEDEILANPDKTHDVSMIVTAFTNLYTSHTLGELNLGTTANDRHRSFLEDLCAIPDLAAGTLSEVVNHYSKKYNGRLPRSRKIHLEAIFSEKTNTIAGWLMNCETPFKQISILVDKDEHGLVKIASMELEES